MKKTRTLRRAQRTRIIKRKEKMLKQFGGEEYVFAWTRGDAGRLAKSKIHCSCWMCRRKSYDAISRADKRRLISARQQLKDEV